MSDGEGRWTVSPVARDALCEILNIGSGNAVISLGRLLGGRPIRMSVPRCFVGSAVVGTVAGLDRHGVSVRMNAEGVTKCTILILFDDPSARALVSALTGRESTAPQVGSLEESALLETVNIASCSFLGALSTLMRGTLIPTAPAAEYGNLEQLLRQHLAEQGEPVVVTDEFSSQELGFTGRVFVLMGRGEVTGVLSVLGLDATGAVAEARASP